MHRADDAEPTPEEMGRCWDAIVGSDQIERNAANADVIALVGELHARDTAPAPDSALVERMWWTAVGQASISRHVLLPPDSVIVRNGYQRPKDAQAVLATKTVRAAANRRASALARVLAIAVIAGMGAGAIAIGLGARLAMRVAALAAGTDLQGMMTQQGERVGEITFGGTLFLVMMGVMFGIVGGVLFVAVRPWLPWTGQRRGLVFGAVLLVVGGSTLLEGGNNPDYQRFGYAGLNLCLFSVLPVGFGLLVGSFVDRLERTVPSSWPRWSGNWAGRIGSIGVVVLALFGIIGAVSVLLSGELVALLLVPWVVRVLVLRVIGRFESPIDLLRRPRIALAAYVVFALPCLVGLVLTIQAMTKILTSG